MENSIMDTFQQSQLNKSRKDKFLMVLSLPTILKKINTSNLSERSKSILNLNSLQFSIYGTVIPSVIVPPAVAGYAGQNYKVSTHSRPPYDDLTVNFTVDNLFTNYWVIYKWLDLLNDDSKSYYNADDLAGKNIPANYQTDIVVYAKDEFDKNIMKFTYTKAFPTGLGGFDYSYRDSEEIGSNVTFAFSQFISEPL
jgi:hypothetical protein